MTDNTCSPDDFEQADSAAESISNSSINSSIRPCSANSRQSSTLCDIGTISIFSTPNARRRYRVRNGRLVQERPSTSNRELSIPENQARSYEMVAPRRHAGSNASFTIRVISATRSCSPSTHPLLQISGPGYPRSEHRGSNTLEQQVEVWRSSNIPSTPSHPISNFNIENYWTMHLDPNIWIIDVDSCGNLGSDSAISSSQVEIKAYPDDQYSFALTIPNFNSFNESHSQTRNSRGSVTESHASTAPDVHCGSREVQTVSTTTHADDGTELEVSSSPLSSALNFAFKCNDRELSTDSLRKIVTSLREIEQTLRDIRELIRDFVPQIGWKFDWEVSFFEGSMLFSWGWREHTDHRVFMAWSAGVNLKIIRIKLELSFGISLPNSTIEAKIEGSLEGDASINFSNRCNSPDRPFFPSSSSARVRSNIQAALTGKIGANMFSVRFEQSISVSSGIQVTAAFNVDRQQGPYLSTDIQWIGIVLNTRSLSLDLGNDGCEVVIMDGTELYTGRFPETAS